LKPEARAGSRKSASSLQVTLVFGADVAVACGVSVAEGVSDATGRVAAGGAVVATRGTGVDEMLQANISMDKIARGSMRRFIKKVSFFINL
jgi:hypothetical protein